MKMIIPILAFTLVLYSCNNSSNIKEVVAVKETPENQKFFPVTSYLKGELFNIKNIGINPLKYTTVNNVTDSVWLKIEEMDSAFKEFLTPEIDSSNLITLFTEKSFLDQSINAVTLTYEPLVVLPDSMQLRRWDVYIDPKLNTVKRIYIVKDINKNKTLQLTWVSNKWCKIISIITDEQGESKIEKEEKFIWDF